MMGATSASGFLAALRAAGFAMDLRHDDSTHSCDGVMMLAALERPSAHQVSVDGTRSHVQHFGKPADAAHAAAPADGPSIVFDLDLERAD